jgi:hypothetical protein
MTALPAGRGRRAHPHRRRLILTAPGATGLIGESASWPPLRRSMSSESYDASFLVADRFSSPLAWLRCCWPSALETGTRDELYFTGSVSPLRSSCDADLAGVAGRRGTAHATPLDWHPVPRPRVRKLASSAATPSAESGGDLLVRQAAVALLEAGPLGGHCAPSRPVRSSRRDP